MRYLRTILAQILLTTLALDMCIRAEPAAERCLLYIVERIPPANAPVIDGKLDEAVWQERECIGTLRNFLGDRVGDFASQRSEFTILCDGTNLFIGATFHETEMKQIKASPARQPFWNDCIEVYFDPRHDGTRSIQLVIDCIGQRMWDKKYDEGYGWWTDKAWYMLADWEGRSARGPQAWTIEIRINCAAFEIDPTPGSVCGFNPCRFRLGAGEEFSAWTFGTRAQKLQKSIPDWGHLRFAAPGEKVLGRSISRADVTRIYGALKGRCIEAPTQHGFTVFSDRGMHSLTFAEKLESELSRLDGQAEAAADAAESAMINLSGKHTFVVGLKKTLDETRKLQREVRAAKLTIGTCDRFAAALKKAAIKLDNAMWQAHLAVLVTSVQSKGTPQ